MRSLAVLTIMVMAANAAAQTPAIRITVNRDDDQIQIKSEKGRTLISIHSPSGISHAVMKRQGDQWPEALLMRLHLKGLENLKLSNGKITLEAAVSSQDGKTRLWKDGQENQPLKSHDPCWMDIRLIGDDGKSVTAIPLKNGYFEWVLPKPFFDGNPESITVNWIDFYRN